MALPPEPAVPVGPCPLCGRECVGGLEAVDHYRYRIIPDHPATREALMGKTIEAKYVMTHRIMTIPDATGGSRVLFGAGDEVRESVLVKLGLLDAIRDGEEPTGRGFRVDPALLADHVEPADEPTEPTLAELEETEDAALAAIEAGNAEEIDPSDDNAGDADEESDVKTDSETRAHGPSKNRGRPDGDNQAAAQAASAAEGDPAEGDAKS
jgi:hypothetical protein